MSNITLRGAAPFAVQAGGSFQTLSDANLATLVGTRYDTSDGRELIFVSVLSTDGATSGHLMQDAPLIANHQNCTISAFTAYSANGNTPASCIINLKATAVTAGQYAGGFATVVSGTGIGQTLRIANHPAIVASGTTGVITFEDGPVTSLVANDSTLSLIAARGSNVVDNPTTRTSDPVGVAFYPIGGGSYGFLVAKGIVAALSDAKIAAIGEAISPSITTAGCVTQSSATGATYTTKAVIGHAVTLGTSATATAVFLNI